MSKAQQIVYRLLEMEPKEFIMQQPTRYFYATQMAGPTKYDVLGGGWTTCKRDAEKMTAEKMTAEKAERLVEFHKMIEVEAYGDHPLHTDIQVEEIPSAERS